MAVRPDSYFDWCTTGTKSAPSSDKVDHGWDFVPNPSYNPSLPVSPTNPKYLIDTPFRDWDNWNINLWAAWIQYLDSIFTQNDPQPLTCMLRDNNEVVTQSVLDCKAITNARQTNYQNKALAIGPDDFVFFPSFGAGISTQDGSSLAKFLASRGLVFSGGDSASTKFKNIFADNVTLLISQATQVASQISNLSTRVYALQQKLEN